MELNQAEVSPISASTQSLELPVATPTNKNKKPKGLVFGVVFCAILAIAGVVFGIYELVDSNQKSQQISELKAQVESQGDDASLDDATAIATKPTQNDSEVKELIDTLQTVIDETVGKASIKTYDNSIVLTKNEGFKTILPIDRSYGVYSPYTEDINVYNRVEDTTVDKLKELGFIDNSEINGPVYLVGHANMINNNTGIICNILGSVPFEVSCGHSAWVLDETITQANKLSDAYYAVESSYPFSINLTNYAIKDSLVSPYQTLKVPVSNAMGLFYRMSPDADWKYFTATQAVLDCSEFSSQDLKNAFSGEICYDGVQNTTVQP